ncbi:MAG: acetyl-CoA carboxylase, carboxyltransferase subunit beta [Fidelibacterota bacterium]
MVEWFRRSTDNIKTISKKDTAEGIWVKCPRCTQVIYSEELKKNQYVCSGCSHHFRITSQQYLNMLLDDPDNFLETGKNIESVDPLKFKGNSKYTDQLKSAKEKTGYNDAIRTIVGEIGGYKTAVGIMDFSFIGGSMGSVVGEKISRLITYAISNKTPLIIVSASGGARMQEGSYSLMQMAKTSAMLAKLSKEKGLFVSILTDPTTGGTTASFAMLGDIILAEPNALIGFAGARVIKQTIGQELPEGFQRSEFLLQKGFIDSIVHRSDLKNTLIRIFKFFKYHPDHQVTKI